MMIVSLSSVNIQSAALKVIVLLTVLKGEDNNVKRTKNI